MIDLPQLGQRLRIYPMPGRMVIAAPFAADAPLLAHVRHMPNAGQEVVWDLYWFSQLREGAIILHAPPCEEHDHGADGIDECCKCGRTLSDAQVYDVHYAHGVAAAAADAKQRQADAEASAKAADDGRAARVKAAKDQAAQQAVAARAKLPQMPQAQTIASATPPLAVARTDIAEKK